MSIEPMLSAVDLENVQFDKWTRMNVLEGCGVTTRPGAMGQMLPNCFSEKLSWVICGGETGPKARPMHPDWVRSLRDQCRTAGVPFFFKQWGEWAPFQDNGSIPSVCRYVGIDGIIRVGDAEDMEHDACMGKVGKKTASDLLDGRQYHEFPEVSIK